MYALSLQANVDDLKSIEDKSSYVSAADMPDYTKGAFVAMEDERFTNTMALISKVLLEHYFQL